MATSPYFALNRQKLIENLEIIKKLKDTTNTEIYFTLKALNHKDTIEIIAKYLDGFSVSSENEATLAHQAGAKKINLYSVAYQSFNYKNIDRVTFNSITQYKKYFSKYSNRGIRVNPNIKFSKICNYTSPHLGVKFSELSECKDLQGLHFHTMFNANEDDLQRLLEHIDKRYKPILKSIKWINLGGGYNLTKFSINRFKDIVQNFQTNNPNLTLILEPGEGVLKDVGTLNTKIIDIIDNNIIINATTQNHLLDIAMVAKEYKIKQSNIEGLYQYKIYGNSCISSDYFGTYSFKTKQKIGDIITFIDSIAYTFTKQTNFTLIDNCKLIME